MPSHQQQYEPASGSDTDSDSSVEQPRRTARRSRDEDEDSIDGLDAAMDEEKLVGAKGVLDVKEEEDPKLKRLRRSWLMASLPTTNGPQMPGAAKPPPRAWFSGFRLVYLGLTAILVLAIVILGAVLIAKEYTETDADHSAEKDGSGKGSASAYIPTGTLPPLSVPSPTGVMARFPELQALMTGNRRFRVEEEQEHPGLVETLAQGQQPEARDIAYLGCSDSRLPETEILGASLGDLFVTRNIDNQYLIDDLSSETFVSYAVAHLGVAHVLVLGHYGCGAVQAAMTDELADASTDIGSARIEAWIRPIRVLFKNSNHSDIAAFRDAHEDADTIPPPNRTHPAFRALVEENVKQQVLNLADDSSVIKSWKAFFASEPSSAKPPISTEMTTVTQSPHSNAEPAPTKGTSSTSRKRSSSSAESTEAVELFIHGWVYDIDTGLAKDLGVSIGPSGPVSSR